MYVFLLKSGTKVQKNFEICKKSCKFARNFAGNIQLTKIFILSNNFFYVVKRFIYRP